MTPTQAEERRSSKGVGHRRWLIAFLLAFGVLVNYFDRVNLSVAKQALEKDFGISNVAFGYLLSAYNWTYADCNYRWACYSTASACKRSAG